MTVNELELVEDDPVVPTLAGLSGGRRVVFSVRADTDAGRWLLSRLRQGDRFLTLTLPKDVAVFTAG